MKALILVGGKSERMGGYPKCLSFVNGKTVFERQIEWLRKGGFSPSDVLVSYGNRKEVYSYARRMVDEQNLFPDPEGVSIGDAGAIRLAIEKCSSMDEILISMNGDILPLFDIQSFLDYCKFCERAYSKEFLGMIVVKPFKSHLGIVRLCSSGAFVPAKIISFEEKPVLDDLWCSCGIYVFFLSHKDIIEEIIPESGDFARGVLNRYYNRFIPYLIGEDEWIAIETVKDIKVAEELLGEKGVKE